MAQLSSWYIGYDLKRTYQRNFLISMVLVYGTVILSALTYLMFQQTSSPSLVTLEILGVEGGLGNAGPRLAQLVPGRLSEKGSPLASSASDSIPSGFFSLGKKIRVIRSNYPALPAPESYAGAFSDVAGPSEIFGSGLVEGNGTMDDVTGPGNIDYGLPQGPIPIIRYSPTYFSSPGGGSGRSRKNRPLKIHLAGLQWPRGTPSKITCEAAVELTISVNGSFTWKILGLATDSADLAFLPAFEEELKHTLNRTWFEPQIRDGVKVAQTVILRATFCPFCKAEAWADRGDMVVFLSK